MSGGALVAGLLAGLVITVVVGLWSLKSAKRTAWLIAGSLAFILVGSVVVAQTQ